MQEQTAGSYSEALTRTSPSQSSAAHQVRVLHTSIAHQPGNVFKGHIAPTRTDNSPVRPKASISRPFHSLGCIIDAMTSVVVGMLCRTSCTPDSTESSEDARQTLRTTRQRSRKGGINKVKASVHNDSESTQISDLKAPLPDMRRHNLRLDDPYHEKHRGFSVQRVCAFTSNTRSCVPVSRLSNGQTICQELDL